MDAWKRTGAAWNALTSSTDYQENVTYDPNGNILTYHRNRETTGSTNQMDQLQYNYISGTNQLDHINDTVPGVSNAGDVATQSAGNYKYDSIGELIGDAASNITNVTWTLYGKIACLTKSTDTIIKYSYDPAGNRISQTVVSGSDSTVTWYVRDAEGNILSVYTFGDPTVSGGALAQTELDIYGSSRLGTWKRSVPVVNLDSTVHNPFPNSGDSITFTRGNKLFELTNHLGNVLAAISDKRYGVTADDSTVIYYNPEVVIANDYYPFGMTQYARSYAEANVGNYRFGFNGQEHSNEINVNGNAYTAEYWEYDSRIGRRWNLDPKPDFAKSSYSAFSNNPLSFADPLGDTVVVDIMTDKEKRTMTPFKYYGNAFHDDDGKVYKPEADSWGEKVLKSLNSIAASGDFGNFFMDELETMPTTLPIRDGHGFNAHQDGVMYIDPDENKNNVRIPTKDGQIESPLFIVIGHEFGHAYSHIFGPDATGDKWYTIPVPDKDNPDKPKDKDVSKDEIFASFIENRLRAEDHLPLRTYYSPDGNGGVISESSLASSTAVQFVQHHQEIMYKFNTWSINHVHQTTGKLAIPDHQFAQPQALPVPSRSQRH